MEKRFSGRVVMITGAARGMGRSHALAFAREGALVTCLDLGQSRPQLYYELSSQSDLEETAEECRRICGQDAIAVYADVRNASQVDTAVKVVIDTFGRIDVLVNNAGITTGGHLAHELSEEDWDKMLAVNLKGVWLCCKYVIPHMIKQRNGKIINISSVAGLEAFPGYVNYVAAKFGVVGLTKTLAIELAEHGINVNCVCPGMVSTPMLDADAASSGITAEEGRVEFVKGHLFQRLIPAEDISRAILWLASEDTTNVTGIALPIDAGFLTRPPA